MRSLLDADKPTPAASCTGYESQLFRIGDTGAALYCNPGTSTWDPVPIGLIDDSGNTVALSYEIDRDIDSSNDTTVLNLDGLQVGDRATASMTGTGRDSITTIFASEAIHTGGICSGDPCNVEAQSIYGVNQYWGDFDQVVMGVHGGVQDYPGSGNTVTAQVGVQGWAYHMGDDDDSGTCDVGEGGTTATNIGGFFFATTSPETGGNIGCGTVQTNYGLKAQASNRSTGVTMSTVASGYFVAPYTQYGATVTNAYTLRLGVPTVGSSVNSVIHIWDDNNDATYDDMKIQWQDEGDNVAFLNWDGDSSGTEHFDFSDEIQVNGRVVASDQIITSGQLASTYNSSALALGNGTAADIKGPVYNDDATDAYWLWDDSPEMLEFWGAGVQFRDGLTVGDGTAADATITFDEDGTDGTLTWANATDTLKASSDFTAEGDTLTIGSSGLGASDVTMNFTEGGGTHSIAWDDSLAAFTVSSATQPAFLVKGDAGHSIGFIDTDYNEAIHASLTIACQDADTDGNPDCQFGMSPKFDGTGNIAVAAGVDSSGYSTLLLTNQGATGTVGGLMTYTGTAVTFGGTSGAYPNWEFVTTLVINDLDLATASTANGLVMWGDTDNASYDTGTEVCASVGLSCQVTLEADGTEVACGTTPTGTANNYFTTLCY